MASASDAERSMRKSKAKRPSLFKRKGTSTAVPGSASTEQPFPNGGEAAANAGEDGSERPAQLDFTQAMDDFQLMFPTMERDVIETVLRANNGLVDPTINQLLTMTATSEDAPLEDGGMTSSSSEDEVIDHISHPHVQPGGGRHSGGGHRGWTASSSEEEDEAPPGYAAAVAPPPLPPRQSSISAAAALTPPPLYSPSYGGPPGGSQKKTYTRNWNPPLVGDLPQDFLRISISRGGHQHPPGQQPHSQQGHPQQHHRQSRQDSSHRYNHRQSSDMNSAVLRQISENEKRIAHLERKKSVECSSGISSENYQKLDDEVLARYLQNEEFLAMLRGNEEFMATLNQGSPVTSGTGGTGQRHPRGHPPGGAGGTGARPGIFGPPPPPAGAQPLPDGPQVGGAGGPATASSDAEEAATAFPYGMPLPKDEEAELKEKLKHMDNPSRRMFLKMANFFHAHKRRRPEQMLGGSTPATAYLLGEGGGEDEDEDQLLGREDDGLPSPQPGGGCRP